MTLTAGNVIAHNLQGSAFSEASLRLLGGGGGRGAGGGRRVKGICSHGIFRRITKILNFFTSGLSQLQAFEESAGRFAHCCE
jgi:hypothetical protein